MKEWPVGSTVGYRDHTKNQFNVGIVSERQGRSCAPTTESGQNVSQNCIDLKCNMIVPILCMPTLPISQIMLMLRLSLSLPARQRSQERR